MIGGGGVFSLYGTVAQRGGEVGPQGKLFHTCISHGALTTKLALFTFLKRVRPASMAITLPLEDQGSWSAEEPKLKKMLGVCASMLIGNI